MADFLEAIFKRRLRLRIKVKGVDIYIPPLALNNQQRFAV